MNYSITTSSYFDVAAKKLAKKYSSFKDDLVNFGKSLLENPKQGTELAPGIRKIRMAIKSKGKFYDSDVCRLLHYKDLGLHLMSDTYIVNDLIAELRNKQ